MPPTIAFFTDPALAGALPRIRYVLDGLAQHPLAPAGVQLVLNPVDKDFFDRICVYGNLTNKLGSALVIPAQHKLFFAQPFDRQLYALNEFDFKGRKLYAVESLWIPTGQTFFQANTFAFDWLETLFFHLSRFEEYAPKPEDLDDIGNMKSAAQLFPKHGLHHIPVADHLVAAVFEALGFAPKNLLTTFSISHDVDDLQVFGANFKLLRYLGGVFWRHQFVGCWPRIIRDYRQVRQGLQPDPGDTFDWLLRLGPTAEKTIYFGFGNHSPYDHFPDLKHPRLQEVREMALELGYEPGMHPSFDTWKNAELFKTELQTAEAWFGRSVRHSRQHYLHFAFPETADLIEQNGLETDATLGFRDRVGFRAGTGFPFHLYCFKEERPYRWKEMPLVAMDCGLVREWGRGPHHVDLRSSWVQFVLKNRYGTAISLSLHNTYCYEQALHGIDFRDLFGSVLKPKTELI
jgi:hypothetical protein